MKSILAAILTVISLLFTGCETDTSRLSKNATLTVTDYIELGEATEKRTVEIIDSDTLKALWEIIEAQQQCELCEGDNYLAACPKLTLAYPNGREVTISYTWCSEEYGTDPVDDAPTVSPTGECFLIHGDGITKRYTVKDRETENRFHSLLSEYVANTEPEPQPGNDVLLVMRYTNCAWGKQDHGSVIDRNGDMYTFDIASHSVSQSEFLDLMRELIKTNEPVQRRVFDENKINQILDEAEKVDVSAKYSERTVSYDRGQDTLYVLRGDSLITLRSMGDWERKLNDPAAKKICQIYDNRNNAEITRIVIDKVISGLKNLFAA
ncbi:MAG: hypothetical protein ACI4QY_01495 [Oscillospiraceae bacterium]